MSTQPTRKGEGWRSRGGKLLFGDARNRRRREKRAELAAKGLHPSGDTKRCENCHSVVHRLYGDGQHNWDKRKGCSKRCARLLTVKGGKKAMKQKFEDKLPHKVKVGEENGVPVYRVGRGEGVMDFWN